MNDVNAASASAAEWSEAGSRVRSYLEALQILDRGQQDRILAVVLPRAAARQLEQPGESPTALSMREVHVLAEEWFARILGKHDRAGTAGVVCWFALDAAKKWPGVFLTEQMPPDFQAALQGCAVNAVPNLKLAPMVPQPFDNPLRDLALPNALGELTKNFSPSIVARAVAVISAGLAFLSGNRLR